MIERNTWGERLQRRREDLELTVHELAQEISAPPAFIQALEENRLDAMSAKVYALGFFKKLLTALALTNQETWIQEFNTEWEIQHIRSVGNPTRLPGLRKKIFFLTPQRIGFLSGGIIFILAGIFIGARFTAFIRVPRLVIDEPRDNIVLNTATTSVRGRIEKESRLTVNGREITLDESGNFSDVISLDHGLNALEFIAENRFGKQSTAVRHILVE